MRQIREENAVSPVVGVMLMLVVTIIIAALVSTFAGGLSAETPSTPTTVLGVEDYTLTKYTSFGYLNYDLTNMTLKNSGSVTLSTAELSIVLESGLASKTYKLPELMDNKVQSWGAGEKIKIHKDKEYGLVDQSVADGTPIQWKVIYNPSGNSLTSGSFVISTSTAKIIDETT